MTISTTTSKVGYNGNGVTTAFSVPFLFLANADLTVVLLSSAGVETTLTLSTHYTVTGAGNDSGGTLTMVTPPAVGERLTILREVALTQETDYISGDPFPAETHERALDRLVMIAQQLTEVVSRSLRFPVSDTASPELPAQSIRMNKLLAFDSNGDITVAAPVTDSATDLRLDLADPTGATHVGADDGASGTVFTTVAGFISYILSSAGAALMGFIQAGVGAVRRSVQSKLRDVISVKDFGAIGDGVTDDTSAFQSAIDAIIAAGGGVLHVPAGMYRISSLITATCTAQQHIRIEGQGRYVSTLDFSGSASMGIYFNSTSLADNQLPVFEVSRLGLITSRDDCGSALYFNYANSNNIDAAVYVEDVLIAQNIDRIADSGSDYGYWTTGIRINNARNSELRNIHAYGEMNQSPTSSRGVWLEGESTAVVISDSLFMEWTTGVEATGTCEGTYLSNTDIVFCRYGARHTIASGAEPQFTVVGCSFNCANVGVWLTNSQQSVIADSLFYATSALDAGPWPEWTGVLIQGTESRFNKVHGCTFAKESGRTGDTTNGIDFNQGRNYTATGNHFFGFSGNTLTHGVHVRSGVTNVVISEDNLFEYVTNLTNFSTGTKSVRQKTIRAGSGTYSTGDTITFDQAFNESVTSVVAVHYGTNSGVNAAVSDLTTTSFKIHHNAGSPALFTWTAVGS